MKKILLASISLAALSSPAFATFTVYSPNVNEGKLELEAKARYDVDDKSSRDNYRRALAEANYGVTDWWKAGVEFLAERKPNDNTRYYMTELTSTFELAKPEEYFFQPGVRLVYAFDHRESSPDKVEALLLLQRKEGKFTHTFNAKLEKQIRANRTRDLEGGLSYRLRYDWMPMLNPAFEYYNALGEFSEMKNFSKQQHRAGPVLWGKLYKSEDGASYVSYEAGYLHGLTPATQDGAFKFKLEYEFPL